MFAIQLYMTALPRIARVPHTTKVPDACHYCGGHNLTRRGTRKKKLEIVQLWRCASCKRVFTPGPAALHNKTYPLRMILSALSDYRVSPVRLAASPTFRRSRTQFGVNFRLPWQPKCILWDTKQREDLALQLGELDVEDLHELAVLHKLVPLGEAEQT